MIIIHRSLAASWTLISAKIDNIRAKVPCSVGFEPIDFSLLPQCSPWFRCWSLHASEKDEKLGRNNKQTLSSKISLWWTIMWKPGKEANYGKPNIRSFRNLSSVRLVQNPPCFSMVQSVGRLGGNILKASNPTKCKITSFKARNKSTIVNLESTLQTHRIILYVPFLLDFIFYRSLFHHFSISNILQTLGPCGPRSWWSLPATRPPGGPWVQNSKTSLNIRLVYSYY